MVDNFFDILKNDQRRGRFLSCWIYFLYVNKWKKSKGDKYTVFFKTQFILSNDDSFVSHMFVCFQEIFHDNRKFLFFLSKFYFNGNKFFILAENKINFCFCNSAIKIEITRVVMFLKFGKNKIFDSKNIWNK